jgi:hypothetical protein
MFSIITDKDGNPLSKEEMGEMEVESLTLLLRGYLRKMNYLRKKDKIALSYITNSLLHRFQHYYGKKEDEG